MLSVLSFSALAEDPPNPQPTKSTEEATGPTRLVEVDTPVKKEVAASPLSVEPGGVKEDGDVSLMARGWLWLKGSVATAWTSAELEVTPQPSLESLKDTQPSSFSDEGDEDPFSDDVEEPSHEGGVLDSVLYDNEVLKEDIVHLQFDNEALRKTNILLSSDYTKMYDAWQWFCSPEGLVPKNQ